MWLPPRPTMAGSRAAAVAVIAVAAAVVTATQFASSYHNLLDWALRHQIGEPWAWLWPIGVDSFVVIGEARLFVAAIDGNRWHRGEWQPLAWAWGITLAGLAASTAANIGHAGWDVPVLVMVSYSVPPLAAAAGLGTLLGLVKAAAGKDSRKRAREAHPSAPGKALRAVPGKPELDRVRKMLAANPEVSISQVQHELGCRFGKARDLLAEVKR